MINKGANELAARESMKCTPVFWGGEGLSHRNFDRPASVLDFRKAKLSQVNGSAPSVSVFDNKSDLVVRAEMAGIRMEDIDIKLTDDSVSIAAERKNDDERPNYKQDDAYFCFYYATRLPSEVQPYKAETKFNNGVLEIRLPKSTDSKQIHLAPFLIGDARGLSPLEARR